LRESGKAAIGLALVACLALGCESVKTFSPSRVYEEHPSIAPESHAAAEVYFVRRSTRQNSWITLPIYLDDEAVVRLRDGTYAHLRIKPGPHLLGSPVPPPPPFHLEYGIANCTVYFDAGRVYVVNAIGVDSRSRGLLLACSVNEFVGAGTPVSTFDEYDLIRMDPASVPAD